MMGKLIEFCARNRFIVLLFVGMATLVGLWSMKNIKLDALPDISDTQVIIYSLGPQPRHHGGRPGDLPDHLRAARRAEVKDIRGFSDFGFSYVYVIFEDGTDIYWARSRTLEYLSNITPKLPQG